MKPLRAHPLREHRAYDDLLSWMLSTTRTVSADDIDRVALTLFPFKYLLETGSVHDEGIEEHSVDAIIGWQHLQSSTVLYRDLETLARGIDRQLTRREDVFESILIHDMKRVPEPVLRSWINRLASLPLWIPNEPENSFVEWLNAKIDEGDLGLRARELNTPPSISRLMVSLANISSGERVLDPFAGVGALLTEVARQTRADGRDISLFGQEQNRLACAWTALRMFLAKHDEAEIVCASSLEAPAFIDTNGLTRFDVVLCDGPFGIATHDHLTQSGDTFARFTRSYGTSLSTDAAVIQHVAASLNAGGRGILLLPHGFLFRKGPDQRIRQWLVESGLLQAVVGLPAKMLPHTSIEAAVILLQAGGVTQRGVMFVDASDVASTRRGRVALDDEAIGSIHQAVHGGTGRSGLTLPMRRVATQDIFAQGYSLQPRRYVQRRAEGETLSLDDLRGRLDGVEADYRDARNEMDDILRRLTS